MLILASQSPRRKQLLELCGWKFSILFVDINESVNVGETPGIYVGRMAEGKAYAAYTKVLERTSPEDLIIGADTAVVDWQTSVKGFQQDNAGDLLNETIGGSYRILGKPGDSFEARKMLRELRGRTHQVYSAVTVLQAKDGRSITDVCITDVPMREYSDDEISTYTASGDPLDKAGAYAIQHSGFNPVYNLQGCYANVMGLPLCHLTRILIRIGLDPALDVPSTCQQSLRYTCSVFDDILLSEW